MKSGLYLPAGISATAREAACASWFDGPTTKVSNVYLARRSGAGESRLLDGPDLDSLIGVGVAGTGVGSRSDSASRTSNKISKSWLVCARSASSTIDW